MFIKILIFLTIILIPLVEIISGYIFVYRPPKPFNTFFGYRTNNSRKSERSWNIAHQFSGKLLILFGNIFLYITAITYIVLVFYLDVDYLNYLIMILEIGNIIPFLIVIAITEIKLTKFNKKIEEEEKKNDSK